MSNKKPSPTPSPGAMTKKFTRVVLRVTMDKDCAVTEARLQRCFEIHENDKRISEGSEDAYLDCEQVTKLLPNPEGDRYAKLLAMRNMETAS